MCWVQIARTIIVTFVTIKIDLVKAETPDTDDIEVRILESRVSSFSAAYHGHTTLRTTRHYARASRGLILLAHVKPLCYADVKPRKQIICNPGFELEIKLVRL